MITRNTAFLDGWTPSAAPNNDQRARALISLCASRYPIEDIAMALNCSESMVRSLLVLPYCTLYQQDHDNRNRVLEPINLRKLPVPERAVALNPRTPSKDETSRQDEKQVQLLAIEIQRWRCTFEASDQDRQQAAEKAGFLLDESPLTEDGRLRLDSYRVSAEINGIWRGTPSTSVDKSFGQAVGPWLASWIRFWVSDPAIWNRALDLAYAHFGPRSPSE